MFADVTADLLTLKALSLAHLDSDIVDCVYCFDARNFGLNMETNTERVSFRRIRFLVESLCDLRTNLQSQGSNLRGLNSYSE